MPDIVERKVGELTVAIDRENCIGSGNCIKAAPELFEFDDESICAFPGDLGEVTRERAIEACQVCPVEALIVRDSSGTQLVP